MNNYRPISEAETAVVADIQARAFRQSPQGYLDSYRGQGRMDWLSLRLLEDEQREAVAALAIFFRAMSLGGGELEAGLVGSVAVPPARRRRGYARRLMIGLLEELHARQTPISLLFPFSVAWYQALGYGLANFSWFVELPTRLLPDFAERLLVRQAGPDDEPGIRECYRRARLQPRHNGWLARTDWEWQERVWRPEHERVLYTVAGLVQGYLIYKLDWNAVEVVEWVTLTDAAWRGLAAFLASQGEQARMIRYNAPPSSPLLLALQEPYDRTQRAVEFVFHQAARLVSGFTLRVVHLPAALRGRRYAAGVNADFVLEVADPQLPANSAPLRVRIEEGAANVEALSQRTLAAGDNLTAAPLPARLPVVETDVAAFSQLYAGAISAEQARTVGRLRADDATCAALTAALAAAPLHMWQADWF